VKLGLTLPSFREEPEVPLEVASAADDAGLDAVFAFDHLFRVGPDGKRRPALECTTLLGAVAAATSRVGLGSLVARASLRPPPTLAVALDTLQRISAGRLIAAIGAGDAQSRVENESFGLGFGTEAERLEGLAASVRAVAGRGYPVWVGGRAATVGALAAAVADGWNRWGGSTEHFAAEAAEVRAAVEEQGRDPSNFTPSWGGLVVLGASEADAEAKRDRLGAGSSVLAGGPERVAEAFRAYGGAGAQWVIAGPLDSSNPENAALLAELVVPLLH
jgi:alkanesulfonate monooxygenase SsuD/methylene tetrahydromethanopterin reductase-like flavin-dependent oxidoreductase (luciferase family)